MYIHPSAIVDDGVSLAPGVKIWDHCHVMRGASVGEGAMLGQAVFLGAGVRVGPRCRIQNFANLPEGVELAEDVFVGPHVCFTNVKYPRVEYPAGGQYMPTRVGRGASVGASAVVLPGLSLGAYCLIGAGAVVTRDVAPHRIVVGNPARPTGWVGHLGQRLRRREDGVWVCPISQRVYLREGDSLKAEAEP